jgi:hypothetical protein
MQDSGVGNPNKKKAPHHPGGGPSSSFSLVVVISGVESLLGFAFRALDVAGGETLRG